ncbi:hypothetical protein LTS18_006310, partial [Coniosporium uncinatum]
MSSPLDRRPGNPNQPISFKTDVNRKKTQKWMNAKQYSYDGGDWDEFDEGDEYGVEAPPPPRPTGLRQPGQGVGSSVEGQRDVTGPTSQSGGGLDRVNSFDAGDERRAFSGTYQPHIASQMQQPVWSPSAQHPQSVSGAPTGMRRPSNPPQPDSTYQQSPSAGSAQLQTNTAPQQQHTNMSPIQFPDYRDSPGRNRHASDASFAASDVSSPGELYQRRDFSPSAMPQPLHSRTQGGASDQTAPIADARFPPRKSSLSHDQSPYGQRAMSPSSDQDTTPTQQRVAAPVTSGRPLPFIRPADIYKRMEEERARERQSMDSERPSIDSLAAPEFESKERSNSDASSRRSNLEPVQESHENVEPQGLGTYVDQDRAADSSLNVPSGSATAQRLGAFSLPSVAPVSMFGDDFWATSKPEEPTNHAEQEPAPIRHDLSHTPSLGFRSVVHQAFDRPEADKSVPPTPVSKSDSLRTETDSAVSRSDTNSTGSISPIMSRIPGADYDAETPTGPSTQSPIAEEPTELNVPDSRPDSTATLQSVQQIPRRPSPSHSRNVSGDSRQGRPPSFSPGYRRDLNTPSPNNSPARSPAIEPSQYIPEPEVGEIASDEGVTSPNTVPAARAMDLSSREADVADAVNRSPTDEVHGAREAEQEARRTFLNHRSTPESSPIRSAVSPARASPKITREESPSKGR